MTRSASDTAKETAASAAGLTRFNLISAGLLFGLAVVALVYVIPMQIPLPAGMDQGLSARFMPRLAAWATLILSGLLFAEVLIRHLRGLTPLEEDNEDNDQQGFGAREVHSALILIVGLAAYIALLYLVGFLIATAILLLACLWAGGLRNPIWLALLCMGFPYALKQMLWHGLYVVMPAGMF